MTSQIPAFRFTVAKQMEAYKERFAERLNAELIRRGEQPRDMANALRIEPRTVERWVAAESYPQRRMLKAAADYLELSVDELRPDLEAEEKRIRAQLDRIEEKVDALLGWAVATNRRDAVVGLQAKLEEIASKAAERSDGTGEDQNDLEAKGS